MRNRSNSGIRLDYFQRLVNRTILKYQNPATGLISSREDTQHSWVRDNVYSILSVWGLALAYRKTADLDEDRAKAYELEKAVVMLMRGLLRCMMMQCDKLEKFKTTQSPLDALHAKYCTRTGKTVVGDTEWGHLQIDATSIYLLTLAQMTASGLCIVKTLDEVAFVQNLVFYIETAYRTPDYGIWERGDKTNHGLPELNSSSIGMAKAALDAINELDLFAAKGGPSSVIHVLPDEAQQCQAILMSMLPRESNSKEVDAGLLTVIGYPAFAVRDPSLIQETRDFIRQKLDGKYGCSRFLRDGYKTPKEDPNRLYYEPSELMQFENIESQWPLFFAFHLLDGLFRNDKEEVEEYKQRLDAVMLKTEDGIPIMPELYSVPAELAEAEKANPNSQRRVPNGQRPHMWGQSLYILSRLMYENFLSPGELDPLNRRQIREDKPDVVVQVVILAEDAGIANLLSQHGIQVQTLSETQPIQVHPARILSQIFSRLGKSKRLGLSGRPSGEIGLLATSKLYMLDDKIFAFIPQFIDHHQFYVSRDLDFLVDQFETDVDFLASSWIMLGRPVILFPVSKSMLDNSQNLPNALIATLKKLQMGYISGARVHLGKLADFRTTSCMTQLHFLHDQDDPSQRQGQVMDFIDNLVSPTCPRPHLLSHGRRSRRASHAGSHAVSGIVRRSRSIQISADQLPELFAQLNDARRTTASLSKGGSSAASSAVFKSKSVSAEDNARSRPSSPPQPSALNTLAEESGCSRVDSTSRDRSPVEPLGGESGQVESVASRVRSEEARGTERWSIDSGIMKEDTIRNVLPANATPSSCTAVGPRLRRMSQVHFVSQFGHQTMPEDLTLEERKLALSSLEGRGSNSQNLFSRVSSRRFGSDSSVPGSPLPSVEDVDEPQHFLHLRTVNDSRFELPHSPHHSPSDTPIMHRHTFEGGTEVNVHELLESLKKSESLQDQADIIHYLYAHLGPEWETGIDNRSKCTARDLMVELYEKAGHWKQWWLVRHTAGMLKKRVEDLAIAATDLVVRQKQLSVGMPPDGEHIITCPLPPEELANIIFDACGADSSSASLTQELLIYLAMFIRTEPKLFSEMLRLRVGLIIQVMASEMSRTLKCTGDEASDHLLNLSPFEMKTLLHHILSGKEFNIKAKTEDSSEPELSILSKHSKRDMMEFARKSRMEKVLSGKDLDLFGSPMDVDDDDDENDDRQGQWLRRRRLDGALNRVPVGFYPRIWRVLRRCPGLVIDVTTLPRILTEEMTEGEFKFAMEVEIALNKLPEPEYRQLMVEAMMVLATMVENDNCKIGMDSLIRVDSIVQEANRIFIADQGFQDEDACVLGARGICQHLYDSAPSGRHGTMTYMCRALARILKLPINNGDMDCVIS